MKKLMIAAATTAIAGGVFGATAQVYDMTLTVKATECAQAKKAYKNVCADNVLLYRKQTTQKFYGKFWGCGCDVIACPDNYGQPRLVDTKSFMFWGKSAAFHDAEMAWSLLQLVGQKGTNIEGAFNLKLSTCEKGDNVVVAYDLDGAGYGTATVKACADENNAIKSMSGNVVGVYNVVAASEVNGCKYCGESAECTPWAFCDTCGTDDPALSAAFGSFTIKYNASQAKKLAAGKWIDEANKFNKFVTEEFACIAAAGTTPEPTPGSAAQANYDAAKKAYADATNALAAAEAAKADLDKGTNDCEQGQALAKAVTDAARAVTDARTATNTATQAYSPFQTSLPDVYNAQNGVATAEEALEAAEKALDNAKTESAVATAKADIEAKKTALDNAKKALENARKGVDQKQLDEFDAAYAKKAAADKALKEAEEAETAAQTAQTDWATTGYGKAVDDAKKAVDDAKKKVEDAEDDVKDAKLVCTITGADCK